MASRKTCLLAALCAILIAVSFITGSESASCCMKYSKRHLPPCSRIKGYTIQTINGSCDISAIIFHVQRRFVCADPSNPRTLQAMKCVKERRRMKTN